MHLFALICPESSGLGSLSSFPFPLWVSIETEAAFVRIEPNWVGKKVCMRMVQGRREGEEQMSSSEVSRVIQ